MKNSIKQLVSAFVLICVTLGVHADIPDHKTGALGAAQLSDKELTVSKMLVFSIEDEYLARGEYQKIIETFGPRRPFINIVKAEERHIAGLKPLFIKYAVPIPADCGMELAKVPDSFSETFQIGIEAEIANIAMYERFLKQELPDDIRDIFQYLLQGSEHHLKAFRRGKNRFR